MYLFAIQLLFPKSRLYFVREVWFV